MLSEFARKLADSESFETEQTKNAWIQNKLSETKTNLGTAKIISSSKMNEKNYLDEYEQLLNSTNQDFLKVLDEYFLQEPLLQIFSSESKK